MTWRRGSVVPLEQSIDSQGGKIGAEFVCKKIHFTVWTKDDRIEERCSIVERAVGCRARVCVCVCVCVCV